MKQVWPRLFLFAAAVAGAAMLVPAAAAAAQDEIDQTDEPTAPMRIQFAPPAGLSEAFIPDFMRRDVQLLNEHFALDDAQQAIVESLYADYERQFQQGTASVRERINALRPTPEQMEELRRFNHSAIERKLGELVEQIRELQEFDTRDADATADELRDQVRALREQMQAGDGAAMEIDMMRSLMAGFDEIIAQWEVEKSRLYEQLLADAKIVLSEEQLQRWPAFERKLRRVKLLPKGELSGESTDVLTLVKELDLEPNERPAQSIVNVLAEFEIALDEALRQRSEFLKQSRSQRATVLHEGDLDAAGPLIDTETRLRVAVRDTNERYARSIAETLSGEAGQELWQRFQQRSYTTAFRTTRARRAFDAIVQIPDLEPALTSSIEHIRSAYDQQLQAGRDEHIALTRQHEPQQLRRRFMVQVARARGEHLALPDDNPLFKAAAALREADQRFIEQALSILSEDQIANLPAFVLTGTRWSQTPSAGAEPAGVPTTPQQRQAFAARFDANGDGRLDEQERARFREAMRELYMTDEPDE